MDVAKWKKKITKACKDAGTYKPFFGSVIDTLAGIMANRDDAREQFEASGGKTVVEHTNKGGATNIVKNPAMVVMMECDAQALAYWKELGLTAKSYKDITKDITVKKTSALEEALKTLVE